MNKVVRIIVFSVLFLLISFSVFIGIANYFSNKNIKKELVENSLNKSTIQNNLNSDEKLDLSYLEEIKSLKSQIDSNSKEITELKNNQKEILKTLKEKDKIIESLKKQVALLFNNKEDTKKEIKYNKWQISTGYVDVYGPYTFDNDLLFIYPDGSYSIITIEGVVKKKGKMGHSAFVKPIVEDKNVYYMSKDGFLSFYDFQYEKPVWEQQLNIPGKIELQSSKEYILFSTPDKENIFIHKKTGVVMGKIGLGSWDIPPVIWNEKVYCFTGQNINVYSMDNNFKLLEKIDNPYGKMNSIISLDSFLIAVNEKGSYLFNGSKFIKDNPFDRHYIYEESKLLYKDDKTYRIADNDVNPIDERMNLIYMNGKWKVYIENNKSVIKYGESVFDLPEINFKNVFENKESIILVSNSNIIYCRGIK